MTASGGWSSTEKDLYYGTHTFTGTYATSGTDVTFTELGRTSPMVTEQPPTTLYRFRRVWNAAGSPRHVKRRKPSPS